MKKRLLIASVFFGLALGFSGCAAFKKGKCDRCPEYTQVETIQNPYS